MSSPYKYSIIINVYNGEAHLSRAINSVLSQSYKNFELIIWNNKSSDKTLDIIRSFEDERIKYYLAPTHTNLTAARGLAIDKIMGDYVSFLDADDWWHPRKLEREVKYFRAFDIGFIHSNFLLVDEIRKKSYLKHSHKKEGFVSLESLLKKYDVGFLTFSFKSELLGNKSINFNDEFNAIGDFDFVLKIASHYRGYYLNELTSYNRWHSKSLSVKNIDKNLNELEHWVKCYGLIDYAQYKKLINNIYLKVLIKKFRNHLGFTGLCKVIKHNPFAAFNYVLRTLSERLSNSAVDFLRGIYQRLIYKLETEPQFIIFEYKNRSQLNIPEYLMPTGIKISKISIAEADEVLLDDIKTFMSFSGIFDPVELSYKNVIAIVITDAKKIIHCLLVYPNIEESPVKSLVKNNLFGLKRAYFSTAYSLPSNQYGPLALFSLSHAVQDLNISKIDGGITISHPSTPNVIPYLQALGFDAKPLWCIISPVRRLIFKVLFPSKMNYLSNIFLKYKINLE